MRLTTYASPFAGSGQAPACCRVSVRPEAAASKLGRRFCDAYLFIFSILELSLLRRRRAVDQRSAGGRRFITAAASILPSLQGLHFLEEPSGGGNAGALLDFCFQAFDSGFVVRIDMGETADVADEFAMAFPAGGRERGVALDVHAVAFQKRLQADLVAEFIIYAQQIAAGIQSVENVFESRPTAGENKVLPVANSPHERR